MTVPSGEGRDGVLGRSVPRATLDRAQVAVALVTAFHAASLPERCRLVDAVLASVREHDERPDLLAATIAALAAKLLAELEAATGRPASQYLEQLGRATAICAMEGV